MGFPSLQTCNGLNPAMERAGLRGLIIVGMNQLDALKMEQPMQGAR